MKSTLRRVLGLALIGVVVATNVSPNIVKAINSPTTINAYFEKVNMGIDPPIVVDPDSKNNEVGIDPPVVVDPD